jgi:hypothetical protein
LAESTTGVNEPNKVGVQTPVLPTSTVNVPVPRKRPPQITISLRPYIRDRLREAKNKSGFLTYNAIITYYLETSRDAAPFATVENILKDTKPIILYGDTGSGKTHFIKEELLKSDLAGGKKGGAVSNIFVIDTSGEYTDLEILELADVLGMRWERMHDKRVRFVPHNNPMVGEGQVRSILFQLDYLKNEGALKNWCIIIEEGHRYAGNENLHHLLMEARKSIRKLIVVATDPIGFPGTPTLKPKPWQP